MPRKSISIIFALSFMGIATFWTLPTQAQQSSDLDIEDCDPDIQGWLCPWAEVLGGQGDGQGQGQGGGTQGGGNQGGGEQGTAGSDRRLKRDITHIATLGSGIKVYSFRYRWSKTVQVGVMAQDLLANPTYRSAVVLMSQGFYAVNYAELGLKMTTLKEWRALGMASIKLRPASAIVGNASAALNQ
jgi:hypothetical protein